jgi:lipoyl(octanoyl) transferase
VSDSLPPVEWRVDADPVGYQAAVDDMEARAAAILQGRSAERVWLLEHPPLYTGGTSADPVDLRDPAFPVFATGRGGRYTYHGPGQRIGYLSLDLSRRGRDVRCFVHGLEGWVIAALGQVGVEAFRADGRVGIWTLDRGREAKIGAIGVRVRRWITLHGFSVNVAPDLSHFGGIVPCGLPDYPVTSLANLERAVTMGTFDKALAATFPDFCTTLSCSSENEA